MALTWADFNNGESALSVRTKLNTFNNAVVTEAASIAAAANVNADDIDALELRMTTAEGDIDAAELRMTTAEGDIDAAELRLDTAETDIAALENTLSDYNVFGTLYGVYTTPKVYNLTTSYQDLANFGAFGSNLVTASTVNGTFTPTHTAFYKVSLFVTGTTTESSQKIATVALVEDGVVLMEGSSPYISATGINIAFSGIFPFSADSEYKIQIKGDTAGTISVTADNFAIHHVGD
jgi:hypothetical protein